MLTKIGEYVLNKLKIAGLHKKSFSLIDKITSNLSFYRLWVVAAVLSIAVFNTGCSDDEPAEEETSPPAAEEPAPAPAVPVAVKEVCLYHHNE